MSQVARAVVVLAFAPLLMANAPPEPQKCIPGRLEVGGEVISVERTTYACALAPLADGPGCVETFRAQWNECNSDGIDIRLMDGTTRTVPRNSMMVIRTCDLPPGRHVASLCVPAGGRLACDFELSPELPGVGLDVRASIPYRFRYQIVIDHDVPGVSGRTLWFLSDAVELAPHTRHRFRFSADPYSRSFSSRAPPPPSPSTAEAPGLLRGCDVDVPPEKPSPRSGCAHCGAGDPSLFVVIAAALAAALRRRR